MCFPRGSVERLLRKVADRFHVIRLTNHHFLSRWREIDPTGEESRPAVSDAAEPSGTSRPIDGISLRPIGAWKQFRRLLPVEDLLDAKLVPMAGQTLNA